jgi:TolA protein
MSASKDGSSGVSWFWGIVLSLSLHIVIFLVAIFWGFGPMYSGEPESIEGTLVSISELGQPGGEVATKKEEVKPQVPETKEEPTKVEEKKPEEKIQVSKPEKKEPQEEPKKTELKKEETPKEKPKEDGTIVLQEKKKEKKEIAKKPETTEPPKTKPSKEIEKKKEAFKEVKNSEEEMNKVIKEIRQQKLLKELKDKRVASSDSSGEQKGIQQGAGYSTGGSSGGSSGLIAELFVRRVREEIKSNWTIPPNIPTDKTLEARIVFMIDENRKVYDVRVEESSGNTLFDDSGVKAVYKAAPSLPAPPPEILEEAKTEGIEVRFETD